MYFKLFAGEILPQDEDMNLLLTMSANKNGANKTGQHRRTYYKKKKRLGLK